MPLFEGAICICATLYFTTGWFYFQVINRTIYNIFTFSTFDQFKKDITDIGTNYSVPMSVIFYAYFFLRFFPSSLSFCAAISASKRFFSALTWTMSSASFTSTSSLVLA